MAVTKGSGSRRPAQSRRKSTVPDRAKPPLSSSVPLELCETLATFNRGFQQVLADLDQLNQTRLFAGRFRRRFFATCSATLREMRAWANWEMAEILAERSEAESVRFGRLRRAFERQLEDPADALRHAEGSGRVDPSPVRKRSDERARGRK